MAPLGIGSSWRSGRSGGVNASGNKANSDQQGADDASREESRATPRNSHTAAAMAHAQAMTHTAAAATYAMMQQQQADASMGMVGWNQGVNRHVLSYDDL